MAEVNLSLNPTAKNNVTDWQGASRATGVSVGDTGRTTCGQTSFSSSAWSGFMAPGQMAGSSGTTGGVTLTYVMWVKTSVARTVRAYFSRYNGSSDAGTFGSGDVSLSADTWTKIRRTATVPTSGTYNRVGPHIDIPSSGTAGTLQVGAVRIVEGDVPDLEFADGDSSGWSWDGTSGNSTSQESGPPAIDITVDNARAATRATKPLLVQHSPSAITVKAARAAARASRPLLKQKTPAAPLVLRDDPGRWQFILGPARGGWKWSLANAKSRKASFKLTDSSGASFTMRGDDPLAMYVDELATDLHLLRRNKAGVVEQLYRGRVGGASDELSEAGHIVSVPTLDYRAVLDRRILSSGSQVEWNGYDQLWIAYGLITQAQNKAGGDYGIANGNEPLGRTMSRTFELGDSIGQKIQELSQSEQGFDWEILPQGPSALTFQAWAQRGSDRAVILRYGDANVVSITRSVDSGEYANMVRVSGQPPEGSSTPPAIHEGVADGIDDPLVTPQGRWDKAFGTSLTTTAAIADRRTWLLDYHQVIRPSYTIKLQPGFWDGPSHIWLGDTVRLVIVSGRLRVDTRLRVQQIDVDIADDGTENVSITVGAPRPDYARRVAANEKRIDQLERR